MPIFPSKKVFFSSLLVVVAIIGIAFGFREMLCSPVYAFCGKLPMNSTAPLAPHYFLYSPATLQMAEEKATEQSNNKIVLYFWAPWCSTCSSLDDEIRHQSQSLPSNVTILRVDYDHAQELRQQYHVITQHTLIQINSAGQPIATWVGGDLASLKQHLQ